MLKQGLLLTIMLTLCCGSLWSQKSAHQLCGSVTKNGKATEAIVVELIETGQTTLTDKEGRFCFAQIPQGRYSIIAEKEGCQSEIEQVTIPQKAASLHLALNCYQLDEVSIVTKGKERQLQEAAIKTTLIDVKKERAFSTNLEQLMNHTAGVRVRNVGGLGARSDIIVGGFSGRSIKMLRDGIPIDYLGSSMGITKTPTSMLDRIEVYKGVLPTEIGIDALGGVINMVSRARKKREHYLSYETGSYNTHILTFNHYIPKGTYAMGANGFVNYSDNNYHVKHLPYTNEETGQVEYITARLFHNNYRQYSLELFFQLTNRSWADLIEIKLNSFALQRDVQNDFASRNRPFGKVVRQEQGLLIPSLKYQKSMFANRGHLQAFAVYSKIGILLRDTLKNSGYNWKGEQFSTISGSEMGLDLSRLKEGVLRSSLSNLTLRGLFRYELNSNHRFTLNIVNNYFLRTTDDLSKESSELNTSYNRLITGIGHEGELFHRRLQTITQAKLLASFTEGMFYDFGTLKSERKQTIRKGYSLSESLKFTLSPHWLFRVSAENTFRLPDQFEIFGDNTFISSNTSLLPETSINVNFGFRVEHEQRYAFELNSYFRNTKNLIRLKEISQYQSVHLNLDHVRGYGLELDGFYSPISWLRLSGNLTYNDFRFRGSRNNVFSNSHFIKARISNMPFFFANAAIAYHKKDLFKKHDKFTCYWNYNYVHQFYLDFIEKQYEPDGFLGLFGKSQVYTNRIIPIQHVHSLGGSWTIQGKKAQEYSISAEIKNVFDADVFNNFKMQSPGRHFTIKLTTLF